MVKLVQAVGADAHATGTVEHAGIDTNLARGVNVFYNVEDRGSGTINFIVQDSATGVVDSVGAAVQTVGTGLDDITAGGTYSGTTNSTFTIIVDSSLGAAGRDADWTANPGNSGPDDAAAGGTYTGITGSVYEVEIDAEGTPDTFKWRKDAGAYTSGVNITGAAQTLAEGIQITFTGTDNHTLADKWTLNVSPDTFSWQKDSGSVTSDVEITAAAQSLTEGVTVTWGAKLGHTLNDAWEFDVVAETYANVATKTTGVLSSNGDGTIECYNDTQRYVRVKTVVASGAVDAAAVAVIYDSHLAPNPL
jgi:hypothetical protein